MTRTYPDTLGAQADRLLEGLVAAADALEALAGTLADDPERQRWQRDAVAGARAYATSLRAELLAAVPTHQLLARVDLVAHALRMDGWLSVSSGNAAHEAMRTLVAAGVFAYFEEVPGATVACYRVVRPASRMTS